MSSDTQDPNLDLGASETKKDCLFFDACVILAYSDFFRATIAGAEHMAMAEIRMKKLNNSSLEKPEPARPTQCKNRTSFTLRRADRCKKGECRE